MTAIKSCNDSVIARVSNRVCAVSRMSPVAEMFHEAGGDGGDAFARLRRREVAPAFVLLRQFVVKNFQDLVLETAAFTGVQLEYFPLAGAQAGTDEKPERTLREFLQPADGRFAAPGRKVVPPARATDFPPDRVRAIAAYFPRAP